MAPGDEPPDKLLDTYMFELRAKVWPSAAAKPKSLNTIPDTLLNMTPVIPPILTVPVDT